MPMVEGISFRESKSPTTILVKSLSKSSLLYILSSSYDYSAKVGTEPKIRNTSVWDAYECVKHFQVFQISLWAAGMARLLAEAAFWQARNLPHSTFRAHAQSDHLQESPNGGRLSPRKR